MALTKRSLHHAWRVSGKLKTWQLLIVCVVLAGLSVFFLRQNYAKMVSLRSAVFQADEQGKSAEELEVLLQGLKDHVTTHMNTDLRAGNLSIKEAPIQLSGLYQQAVDAEKARVSRVNERLYTEAQADCEKRYPVGLSGSGRIPCIEQYVNERGEKVREIPSEVYMFDFASPSWSPDAAGISIVLTVLFTVFTVLKISLDRVIVAYLHHRD